MALCAKISRAMLVAMRRATWAWIAIAVCSTACGSRQHRAQKKLADSVVPAALSPTALGEVEVKTGRVRAYADASYRTQNRDWETKLRRQLEEVNKIFEPTIGLELELAHALAWERKASSSDMAAMMTELQTLDSGADVHFVLGLVDALPQVTSSLHQLGLARPLGKHVLVRGMNDTKEIELFEVAFDTLDKAQRGKLYEARKKHKEIIVLLHELAHALGALHVNEPRRIVFPTYDHKQNSFSPYNAKLMRITVQQGSPAALLAFLQESDWDGWDKQERELLETLLERARTGEIDTAPEMKLSSNVRPADKEIYAQAVDLADGDAWFEAWELAEPLIDYYPDEPAIQVLACRLAMNLKNSSDAAIARCKKASQLMPDDPEPDLFVAMAVLDPKDVPASVAALRTVEERLAASKRKRADVWQRLATAYQSLGVVSLAESAALKAQSAEGVSTWAAYVRARYALAPDAKLAPEDEPAYVEAVKNLLKAVYARKFADGQAQAKQARKRFGDQPGITVAMCDLEIRRRRYADARKLCTAAIKAYDGASWGHYLTALLDKRDKKSTDAIAHLSRAIELDPELRHAYQILAELYDAAGKTDERKTLAEKFHKQFRYPLDKK